MARLNEILVGRFNRAFQKIYGIKGPPPVATLAPEIMPVHSIAGGIEHRWSESWTRYGFGVTVAAQAANTSAFRIRIPPGSNVLAVIERLSVSTGAAQEIDLGYRINFASDFAVIDTSVSLDGRQVSNSVATLSHSILTAVPTAVIDRILLAANTPYNYFNDEDNEIAIPPNNALELVSTTINIAVTYSIQWRERFLEEGERL
jgi:hypothetical protein